MPLLPWMGKEMHTQLNWDFNIEIIFSDNLIRNMSFLMAIQFSLVLLASLPGQNVNGVFNIINRRRKKKKNRCFENR